MDKQQKSIGVGGARIYTLFGPCRGRHHDACRGAFYDQAGNRHVCSCSHHTQGELLSEYQVKSKQRGLFEK